VVEIEIPNPLNSDSIWLFKQIFHNFANEFIKINSEILDKHKTCLVSMLIIIIIAALLHRVLLRKWRLQNKESRCDKAMDGPISAEYSTFRRPNWAT
jgi:hypothetical protein